MAGVTPLVAHLSGISAEGAVARHYAAAGYTLAQSRWRGAGGEIDLILRGRETIVFVEVKKARSHAEAAGRLLPAKIARIHAAAAEFLAGEPLGELTPSRVDAALVDAGGRVEIIENILAG
jgi:putative endonuclease